MGDGAQRVVQVVVALPDQFEETLEAARLDVLELAPYGIQTGFGTRDSLRVYLLLHPLKIICEFNARPIVEVDGVGWVHFDQLALCVKIIIQSRECFTECRRNKDDSWSNIESVPISDYLCAATAWSSMLLETCD